MLRRIFISGHGRSLLCGNRRWLCSTLPQPQLRRPRQQQQPPPSDAPDGQKAFTVTARALGERLDLRLLIKDMGVHGLYKLVPLPQELTGTALMATAKEQYTVEGQQRDVVLFENGSVVLWNMSEEETRLAVKLFMAYVRKPHSDHDIAEQTESMSYCTHDGGNTRIKDDFIHLAAGGRAPADTVLDKFALSDALATSTRLGHLEQQLDKLAHDLEPWIASLQAGQNVRAPGDLILTRTGQLFRLRFAASMCDSPPDFYWEYEELEALYSRMCHSLSVTHRARLLNTRLQFCLDLCDLLRNQKHELEAHRLEKIIIILIFLEILFAIAHLGMELSK